MTLRRVVLPEAEDEIREALRWYEDEREGLGIEFIGVIEAAMAVATAHPLRSPIWAKDGRYRRMMLRRFPYMLFYELRDGVIEFTAVAHAHRQPGYWLDRTRTKNESENEGNP